MRVPEPLPADLIKQPFTVPAARRMGIGPERLRASDLRGPSRSVRIPRGSHYSLVEQCRPYLELLPDAVISHVTAAKLHGLPVPRRLEAEPMLHLSRDPRKGPPRRRHVTGHRLILAPGETTKISGLSVTSAARTWLDLSSIMTLQELIVAGDHIVSRHHRNFGPPRLPMVSLPELRDYIDAKERIPYLAKSKAALIRLRVGVDSAQETVLRLMLESDPALPLFLPNVPLLDAGGEPEVWVDLGCPEFRTCVEYDGAHHLTPEQQARDSHRDLRTAELGWVQVKISRTDMARGSAAVLAKVRRGLLLAGWKPTGPDIP